MNFVNNLEIVGVVGAAANGQLRFWGAFGPVQEGNSGSEPATPDQGLSIWETRAIVPPPKVGSDVLSKLTSALQKLISNGIILNCPLPLDCESDVTDLQAVRDVLQEIKEALEIVREEHLFFQRQLMTSYLTRNQEEIYRLSWFFMSYNCFPEHYLKLYLLGENVSKVFEKFEVSFQTLYPTVERFLTFIREWSGLYRNGESLNQLELIHTLLTKDFGEKAAEWRQVIKTFRRRLNLSKEAMDHESICQTLTERSQFVQDMATPRGRRCSEVSVISTDGGTCNPDSAYDSEFSDLTVARPGSGNMESEEWTLMDDSTDVATLDTVRTVDLSPQAPDQVPPGTVQTVDLSPQAPDQVPVPAALPMYDPRQPVAVLAAFSNMTLS